MVEVVNCNTEPYFSNLKNEYENLHTKVISLQRELNILAANSNCSNSNFYKKIITYVEDLCLSSKHSDIIFRAPNALIPGHKFVLEARGAVWESHIENGVEYMDIKGFSQKLCENFIRWIYKGTLDIFDYQSLLSLMTLAKEHCLLSLLTQCETALFPLINRQNCLNIYSSAFDSRATKLLDLCFEFISDIWKSLSISEINSLSASVLRSLLEKQTQYPIHLAINLKRDDAVLSLIDTASVEVLVNQLDESGLSPLYLALSTGNMKLAKELLAFGADVNQSMGLNESFQPMILYAFEHNDLQTATFLIANGAMPNVVAPHTYQSLMHRIAMAGPVKSREKSLIELTSLLLESDVDLHLQDKCGNTVLHLCILHNSIGIFSLLMNNTHQLDLNQPNGQGLCPLWLGLAVQFSLDNFLDVDFYLYGFKTDFFTGQSADYASQLVRSGADVNWRFDLMNLSQSLSLPSYPHVGDTLLMACARTGRLLAALFLLDQPECLAQLESNCVEGETVFHVAVEAKLTDLCLTIVERGQIDPNRMRLPRCCSSPTVVVEAVPKSASKPPLKSLNPFDDDDGGCGGEDKESVVSSLSNYESPADFQLDDAHYKCTPLHLAVRHELFDVISAYLKNGYSSKVDWSLLDSCYESVVSLLLWSNQFNLVRQIVDSQTDLIAALNRTLDANGRPSLMIQAIEKDLLNVVQFVIEFRADPNERPYSCNERGKVKPDGSSFVQPPFICPLWTALDKQKWNIADYLMSKGADPNLWSVFEGSNVEVSLIHRALHSKNEQAAVYLVQKNCLVDIFTRWTNHCSKDVKTDPKKLDFLMPHLLRTPLHMGVLAGMNRLVRVMLKLPNDSIDINQQDFDGRTPLHLAVCNGHEEIVNNLLNSPRIDCFICDARGDGVFQIAVNLRQRTVGQLLVQKDPNLALQVDETGRNVLHKAIECRNREDLFFLLQIGMDMDARVKDIHRRFTPLHLAIQVGLDEDLIRSLLLAGSSIDAQTVQKESCLHLAVIYDRPQVIPCLLENGADPNAQDSERNTPLHLAIRHEKVDCLLKLLVCRETCSCINIRGQLPIHLLAQINGRRSVEMLCHLVEASDTNQINAQDAAGNTPLLLAYMSSNLLLCTSLVQFGASLSLTNSEGDNVFSLNRKQFKTNTAKRKLAQLLDSLTREPKWEDGPNCVECHQKFGLTNRKHHCRHCGRLLCAPCSSFELPIIKFDVSKPVRVCEVCFNFLNNPLDSM